MTPTLNAIERRLDNKVDWNRFTWIIGILIALFISITAYINTSVMRNREDVIDLKSIAPVLQADINYIKEDVKEIQKDLKILIKKQ